MERLVNTLTIGLVRLGGRTGNAPEIMRMRELKFSWRHWGIYVLPRRFNFKFFLGALQRSRDAQRRKYSSAAI